MRFSFSKPTSEPDLSRLIARFRSEGFEGLQLKTSQYGPYVDDPQGRLRVWGDDPAIYSALIAFDTLDAAGVERLRRTIDFAVEVGSERVVFCHDRPREGVTPKDLEAFAQVLSEIAVQASAHGIALSLHHHFDQPVMLPADMEVFFGVVSPGSVGLTVDTAHLAKSGIDDIPAFIRDFADVIDNVHLKDYDGEWQLLGEGDLDLPAILAALKYIDYRGWICVDEESKADLDHGLKASRTWLDENIRRFAG